MSSSQKRQPTSGRTHHRPMGVAVVAALSLAACGEGPTDPPPSQAPTLSNFTYAVEGLNLESCPPHGLEDSSRFRWTVDYEDVNGDVVPPFRMLWSSFFGRAGIGKAGFFPVQEEAVAEGGDGFSGTISLTQCIRFAEEESVDLAVAIVDAEGNQSEYVSLRIERPDGALAPPASAASATTSPASAASTTTSPEAAAVHRAR